MHAYLLRTGRTIEPFQRPVGEAAVHNRPLAEQQEERLRRVGCRVAWIDSLEEVREFPSLLLHDDLFFTESALRRFLAHARRARPEPAAAAGAGLQAALVDNLLVMRFETPFTPSPQGPGPTPEAPRQRRFRAYDCFYLHRLDSRVSAAEQCRPLVIPNRTRLQRAPVHRLFSNAGDFAIPRSSVYFTPVRHWTGILAANLIGLTGLFLEQIRRDWLRMPLFPLRVMARAGSLRPSLLLGKTYLAGRGCRVHPTAHVEASILGNEVRIGPHATVRGCVLGDRVEVGPGAVLEGTSAGERSLFPSTACVRGCVVGKECSVATLMIQFCVLGDRAITCPTGGFTDFVLRGSVSIEHEGELLSTNLKLLGGAAGDDSFLGPEVIVLSGRSVPNGCQLVQNPRQWVRSALEPPENVSRVDRGRRRAAAEAEQRRRSA